MMGWEALLTILMKSLTVLAWPPFSLLCPLYASIRAMESDSHSSNQRCLAFWVLFSLFMIMEWELAVLFKWFSWWPHVKGMATIFLLIPYFGGAPYVYKYLIKLYCTQDMCTRMSCIFGQQSTHFVLNEDSKLVVNSDRTTITSQIQEKELKVYQRTYDPAGCNSTKSNYTKPNGAKQVKKEWSCASSCDLTTSNYTRPTGTKQVQKEWSCASSCDSTASNYTRPTGTKQVQMEWSCALCQISTSSESCLAGHLQGKKHKAMENELRAELATTNSTYLLSSKQTRIKGMVILRNLNQIANILNPVSRSIRWCEWIKPEFGWTKLNTDGSIHGEIASFGGLLRDCRGEPICAFVSKALQGDVFLVELWAIWRGLVLSSGMGIKAIWVESDSMSVVKTINKQQPSGPKAYSCLKQIWKLLWKFDKYHISHSWRESNRAADHLARMALWGNDVVLWPVDFPPSLCNIIKDDAEGKKYLRR